MHSASLYFLSVYILFQLNGIIFVGTCRDFFLFLFNPSDCEVAAEIFIIVVNIIHQSLNGWWIFLFLQECNSLNLSACRPLMKCGFVLNKVYSI